MNKIYFVFECDSRRSYDSYCIKLATSNKKFAKSFFQENRFAYNDEDDYILNLAEHDPNDCDINGNILRDLEVIVVQILIKLDGTIQILIHLKVL